MDESFVVKLDDLLLVTVPPHLLDSEIVICRRAVLQGIRQHDVTWVLLNFAQVEICDSLFGRFVQSMAEMARLMGVRVMVGVGDWVGVAVRVGVADVAREGAPPTAPTAPTAAAA